MNIIRSKYVQGTKTLYYTRKLRVDDMFAEQYKALFDLDAGKTAVMERYRFRNPAV